MLVSSIPPHRNIVQYLNHCVEDDMLCLYLSRFSFTLSRVIQMRKKGIIMSSGLNTGQMLGAASDCPESEIQYFTNAEAFHIAREVANGLHHLHSNHVLYRDVKVRSAFMRPRLVCRGVRVLRCRRRIMCLFACKRTARQSSLPSAILTPLFTSG